MAQNETLIHPPDKESSREILEFLKNGEGKLEIGKFKNVTLVLGFTGSGKSTLTQFLTGNDEGLSAAETGEDTGEFTILDKNHQVCRGTIDSCTIIPTLYTDKETKSGFYDCPGFGDTRSAKHDISVTYFIKKVIDSVDSVKLLLTVNHHSLREGVDRQNFMLLVKNILQMVKNIDKFKNGIVLIVTKVDNAYKVNKKTKMAVLVPDKIVIGNIAQFLENAKATLNSKLLQSKSEDNSYYTDAIKFIDILLEKDGDDYSRIALFRRPEEEGPLGESTLLQSGKHRMQKLLQSIQYIPKTTKDFGYTVSADSLNQMHDLIDQVNEKLSMNFNHMGLSIQGHYTLHESKARDVEELLEVLSAGHEALSIIRENRNYKSPIFLFNDIDKLAKTENITFPAEDVADLAHYHHFLGFIHEISGLSASSMEWLNGLKDTLDILSDKINWVKMLVNLEKSLSDYVVLSGIRKYPIRANALRDCINALLMKSFSTLGVDNVEQFRQGSGQCASLEDFLKQVFRKNLEKEFGNARKVKPNVYEWALLKGLLDFSTESSCDFHVGSMLTIKGKYLKFSDINDNECRRSVRSIKILALKKVFIDQSYSRIGEGVEIVIIAPKWEVIGSPRIALNGADGQDRQPRKAYDANSHGLRGYDGGFGDNGGEGGMFWGMGQNCVNCEYLSVSADGGRGGAGQDGGDGANGEDFYTQYQGDGHGKLITVFYNKVVTDIIHYGQGGGNGGNGGDGGRGGPKGFAKFVLFGDGSKPRTSADQGRHGTPGAGGAPGRGGRSERRIHRVQTVLIVPWWGDDDPITLPSAEHGSWGRNGNVREVAFGPRSQFSNPSQTLNDYIRLLQVQIHTSLSDSTTREFLHNVEKVSIDDVKHHVGRRSAVHPIETGSATTIASRKTPSFNEKTSNTITSDTEEPINHYPISSFQGIDTGNSPTPYEIQKITSSESEAQALGDGFGVSHVQSNLLLLDYLYRMNNRVRRVRKKNSHSKTYDIDYAHRNAYRAYVS